LVLRARCAASFALNRDSDPFDYKALPDGGAFLRLRLESRFPGLLDIPP
jgi:hypothetical protein